jgi:hypothetical protein
VIIIQPPPLHNGVRLVGMQGQLAIAKLMTHAGIEPLQVSVFSRITRLYEQRVHTQLYPKPLNLIE